MKRTALAFLMLPALAHADWSSAGFNTFSAEGTGIFTSQAKLAKGTRPLTLSFDNTCWQPTDAIKLNEMLSLKNVTARRRSGDCSATASIRCVSIPAPARPH